MASLVLPMASHAERISSDNAPVRRFTMLYVQVHSPDMRSLHAVSVRVEFEIIPDKRRYAYFTMLYVQVQSAGMRSQRIVSMRVELKAIPDKAKCDHDDMARIDNILTGFKVALRRVPTAAELSALRTELIEMETDDPPLQTFVDLVARQRVSFWH